MPIIIYTTRHKQYRYKITGANNKILVHSESMKTKRSIHKSIRAVIREINGEYMPKLVMDKTKTRGLKTYWV